MATRWYSQVYLKSKHWKKVRASVLASNPRCQAKCRKKSNVVHHLSYERVGAEREDDLMALCSECHNFIHSYIKRHRLPLRSGTIKAINQLRVNRKIARKRKALRDHNAK